ETLQGGRRAIDRQRQLLAHDGDGEVDILDATQDVGYEVTALERFGVAPAGRLIVGGAVDVIEYWTRQPSFRQAAEIMNVVTVAQLHPCHVPPRSAWEMSPLLADTSGPNS